MITLDTALLILLCYGFGGLLVIPIRGLLSFRPKDRNCLT